MRTVVIVQSNSQLIEKYGIEGAKSIRKMLAARIVFPPKEYEDAEAISRELGTCTVRQKNVSRPMWGGDGKSPTVSISEQPRRLLLPQEVKELGPDRMILFYEGLRPVLAHRVCYFRDRFFARRELPPPEVPRLDMARSVADRPSPGSAEPAANADAVCNVDAATTGSGHLIRKEDPEMSADDLLRTDLKLEEFSFDFDDVEIPAEKLTDAQIKERADAFMASILD